LNVGDGRQLDEPGAPSTADADPFAVEELAVAPAPQATNVGHSVRASIRLILGSFFGIPKARLSIANRRPERPIGTLATASRVLAECRDSG
jgi:hypothetical protein